MKVELDWFPKDPSHLPQKNLFITSCVSTVEASQKCRLRSTKFIRTVNFDLVSDTDLTNETQRLKIIACIWAGAKLEVFSARRRRGKYIRLRRPHDTSFNPQRSKKLSSVCTRLVSTLTRPLGFSTGRHIVVCMTWIESFNIFINERLRCTRVSHLLSSNYSMAMP